MKMNSWFAVIWTAINHLPFLVFRLCVYFYLLLHHFFLISIYLFIIWCVFAWNWLCSFNFRFRFFSPVLTQRRNKTINCLVNKNFKHENEQTSKLQCALYTTHITPINSECVFFCILKVWICVSCSIEPQKHRDRERKNTAFEYILIDLKNIALS